MIVIVAGRYDQTAHGWVSSWADCDVGVMTPQDLSVAGWRQRLSGGEGETAIVEGKLTPQNEITGVLTLLPGVSEAELVDIAAGDRPYVAAEMTAFLLFWLSHLKCPVLNRPTPTCLSGPHWRPERWALAAAQAGIPVQPVRRVAALTSPSAEETFLDHATVLVVGTRTLGETDSNLQRQARRLADIAGVELLEVYFSGPECGARFIGAGTFPKLSDDKTAEAVLEYLHGGLAARA